MKNDNSSPDPVAGQLRSGDIKRHRLAAVENENEELGYQDGSGNLSRIFTILLLLHVFLIGAVVLYNIIAKKPSDVVQEAEVAPNAMAAQRTASETTVEPRSQRPAEKPVEEVVKTVEYIVKPGQTLKDIAQEVGATSEQLIKLNNLHENGSLYVGRKLRVPAPAGTNVPVAEEAKVALNEAAEVPATEPAPMPVAKQVEATPSAPAKPQPAPTPPAAAKPEQVPAVAAVAKPKSNLEQPAQKRPEPAAEKAQPASASRTYEVQSGDTFYGIARKHKVDVNALMKINGFGPNDAGKLRKGVKLKLP